MGRRGREYLVKNLTKDVSVGKYVNEILGGLRKEQENDGQEIYDSGNGDIIGTTKKNHVKSKLLAA